MLFFANIVEWYIAKISVDLNLWLFNRSKIFHSYVTHLATVLLNEKTVIKISSLLFMFPREIKIQNFRKLKISKTH